MNIELTKKTYKVIDGENKAELTIFIKSSTFEILKIRVKTNEFLMELENKAKQIIKENGNNHHRCSKD